MKQIKAVIFDADGTLFDSFEMIVSAYTHVSKTHGLPAPNASSIRDKLGSPLRDMFHTFYPGEDIEPLLKTNDIYVTANAMESNAFEGVEMLLEDLTSKGLKLGIVTSGSANILNSLDHHQLRKYFSSIVYTERINKPKPDPEGFLLACHECKVEPAHAVMVGDTIFDIETGKNAGAFASIAITHGYGNQNDLESAHPDYIVQSIAELSGILSSIS